MCSYDYQVSILHCICSLPGAAAGGVCGFGLEDESPDGEAVSPDDEVVVLSVA